MEKTMKDMKAEMNYHGFLWTVSTSCWASFWLLKGVKSSAVPKSSGILVCSQEKQTQAKKKGVASQKNICFISKDVDDVGRNVTKALFLQNLSILMFRRCFLVRMILSYSRQQKTSPKPWFFCFLGSTAAIRIFMEFHPKMIGNILFGIQGIP